MPTKIKERSVTLTDWEYQVLSSHTAATFLTYLGHAHGAGLFEKEKADMERWRALSDKFK